MTNKPINLPGESVLYVAVWGDATIDNLTNDIPSKTFDAIKEEKYYDTKPPIKDQLIYYTHPFNNQEKYNGFSKIKIIEKENGHYSYILENKELKNGDRIQTVHCTFIYFIQTVFCYDEINKKMTLQGYESDTISEDYFLFRFPEVKLDTKDLEKYYRFRFITQEEIEKAEEESRRPRLPIKRRCCSRMAQFFGEKE